MESGSSHTSHHELPRRRLAGFRSLLKPLARPARVALINAGLLPASFFIVPVSKTHWWVRKKQPPDREGSSWHGVRLRPGKREDKASLVHVFIRDEYALTHLPHYAGILTAYRSMLASGKTPLIIDCGANIGLASLYLSLCFPRAFILAVEPDADNIAMAKRNVTANVHVFHGAVSDRDRALRIVDPLAPSDAFRVDDALDDSVFVSGFSVPSLVAIANRLKCDLQPFLIKIDVEGYEETLFASDTSWIERFHVLMIELHDWMLPGRAVSQNFLRAITRRKRDFIASGPIAFSVDVALVQGAVAFREVESRWSGDARARRDVQSPLPGNAQQTGSE